MKRISITALVLLGMVVSYVAGRHHIRRDPPVATRDSGRVLYWVDPMHPDYRSDHAGIAPGCGMELQPVYAENTSPPRNYSAAMSARIVGIDSGRPQRGGIRVAA